MKKLILSSIIGIMVSLVGVVSEAWATRPYPEYISIQSADTLPPNITVENVDVRFPYAARYYSEGHISADTAITITPDNYLDISNFDTLNVAIKGPGIFTFQLLGRNTNPNNQKYKTQPFTVDKFDTVSIALDMSEFDGFDQSSFRQVFIRNEDKKPLPPNCNLNRIRGVWFTKQVTTLTLPNVILENASYLNYKEASVFLNGEGSVDVSRLDQVVIPIDYIEAGSRIAFSFEDTDSSTSDVYSGIYYMPTSRLDTIRIGIQQIAEEGVDLSKLAVIKAYFGEKVVRSPGANADRLNNMTGIFFKEKTKIGIPWFEGNPVQTNTDTLIFKSWSR